MSSVFKYCTPKKHYLVALRNNQLNLSFPRYLNDEAEGAARLIEPYKKFCEDVRWGTQATRIFEDQAIASFTNGNRADNMYFWERYAENSRGFAVEYDKDILTNLPNIYRSPIFLNDVSYVDELLNIDDYTNSFTDFITGKEITVNDCINGFKDGDYQNLEYLFRYIRFVKLKAYWEQECESRIVIGQIARSSKYLHPTPYGFNLDLPNNTIKSITIGTRMCRCYRKAIVEVATNNGHIIYEQVNTTTKQ